MSPRPTDRSAPPPGQVPVWLPWLAAPAFFLLPIGGCGGMAAVRQQAVSPTALLPGPAEPMATVATVVPTAR